MDFSSIANNLDRRSDWTFSRSNSNQTMSPQSIWTSEHNSNVITTEIELETTTLKDSSLKIDVWHDDLAVESETTKASKTSYWKAIAIGLVIGVLAGSLVLAVVTTLWIKSNSTTINTTVTTTTSTTFTTSTSTSSTTSTSTTTTTTSTTTSTTSTTSQTTTTSTTSTSTSTTTTVTTTTTATTTTTLLSTISYSQGFTSGVTPSSQCTVWTSFVAQLLAYSYTSLTINGTYASTGITITDPTVIGGIALALRTSASYGAVVSNGRSWMVGMCGGGAELSAAGSICACPSPDYIIRPCIGNSNFGGFNTATCGGPTQTMTVTFTY